MKTAPTYPSDVAFTSAVKEIQSRKGSRPGYARMEEGGSWETTITPELAAFIGEQISVFIATASADGQPYIQHRGGPKGFLHVLDGKTEVPPVSWTPKHLCFRSPLCQRNVPHIRPSSGGR